MTDQVAIVLDGLSRRDGGTRPEDLVFTLGFNEPFHQDTVRKRFYVALKRAGLGALRERATTLSLTTASSSTTCGTPSAPWPSKPFRSQT
jgi:hypothetical protein